MLLFSFSVNFADAAPIAVLCTSEHGKKPMQKINSDRIYCVTSDTAEKLVQRGWGTIAHDYYQVKIESSHCTQVSFCRSPSVVKTYDYTDPNDTEFKNKIHSCVQSRTYPYLHHPSHYCIAIFNNGTEIHRDLFYNSSNYDINPYNINPKFVETFYLKNEQKPAEYLYIFDTDMTCETEWWEEYLKIAKADAGIIEYPKRAFIKAYCITDEKPIYPYDEIKKHLYTSMTRQTWLDSNAEKTPNSIEYIIRNMEFVDVLKFQVMDDLCPEYDYDLNLNYYYGYHELLFTCDSPIDFYTVHQKTNSVLPSSRVVHDTIARIDTIGAKLK